MSGWLPEAPMASLKLCVGFACGFSIVCLYGLSMDRLPVKRRALLSRWQIPWDLSYRNFHSHAPPDVYESILASAHFPDVSPGRRLNGNIRSPEKPSQLMLQRRHLYNEPPPPPPLPHRPHTSGFQLALIDFPD